MIRVTDIERNAHYLAPSAIATISTAGDSSQWHGIQSIVRTFDKRVYECRETPDEIVSMLDAALGEGK